MDKKTGEIVTLEQEYKRKSSVEFPKSLTGLSLSSSDLLKRTLVATDMKID